MSKEKWTIEQIPDLTGKIIIVTGGNSGLGFESAKAFAKKGAEVIIACRSLEKGEDAKSEILVQNPNSKIKVMELDLMDLNSIKNFAAKFKQHYLRLDVLLNNAGIMTTPYGLTKDGFESQFGTNHLGHFALTGLLLEVIVKTPKSRVVNVSSMAHKAGKMDFDNLQFDSAKGYTPMKAYGRSKLSNLLFTYELQRFFEANNIGSIALAAHPGVANTNLARHLEHKFLYKFIRPLADMVIQKPKMGALPQIRAAVDINVKAGEFYGPKGFMEMTGYPILVKSNSASHNVEDAKKLWDVSEKLTGIRYEVLS
jgi:NAD(P)-dependent dehydrogenase (short-subunit alcohol dehydrogenase family)